MRAFAAPVLLLALLAGCKSEEKAEGKVGAAGELLPASTSDAMLPLDSVQSQAGAEERSAPPISLDKQQPRIRPADTRLPTRSADVPADAPQEESTPDEAQSAARP